MNLRHTQHPRNTLKRRGWYNLWWLQLAVMQQWTNAFRSLPSTEAQLPLQRDQRQFRGGCIPAHLSSQLQKHTQTWQNESWDCVFHSTFLLRCSLCTFRSTAGPLEQLWGSHGKYPGGIAFLVYFVWMVHDCWTQMVVCKVTSQPLNVTWKQRTKLHPNLEIGFFYSAAWFHLGVKTHLPLNKQHKW